MLTSGGGPFGPARSAAKSRPARMRSRLAWRLPASGSSGLAWPAMAVNARSLASSSARTRRRSAVSVVAGSERAEGRIRDETDADVAGAPNDVDLLLEGQVAHGPGAEGEV